jgi:lysophospholipid hydrolase
LAAAIQEVLGRTQVEDLWLRFFTTSTNLSRGGLQVHDRGGAGRAVRAAQSLLGLLPPVSDAQTGDLLVDGGYLTSYPVDVMRGRFGVNTVIVVDASGERDAAAALRSLAPLDGGVSGWRLLWERLLRLGPTAGQPRYETLVAALLSAVQRSQLLLATRDHPIDVHIRPAAPARLPRTRGEQEALIRSAYKHSLAAVAAWQRREAAAWDCAGGAASSSLTLINAGAGAAAAAEPAAAATQRWVADEARADGPRGGAPVGPRGRLPPPWVPAPLPAPVPAALSPLFSGMPIQSPRARGGEAPREAVAALLSRNASVEEVLAFSRGGSSPRGSPRDTVVRRIGSEPGRELLEGGASTPEVVNAVGGGGEHRRTASAER